MENIVTTRRNIDSSQIETIYNKAHIAVDLVKLYQPNLLEKISVIANLASGAYGIYNSGENAETGDTIHINVRRIMQEKETELEVILEIASTIIHESSHEVEMALKGTSDETYPKQAEDAFINWVKQNWQLIIQRLPELAQMNT